MPFYEILTISKAYTHNRIFGDLLKQSATKVLDSGGAVRGFAPLFIDKELPHRMRKNKEWQTHGSYWVLHFYTNPQTAKGLLQDLRADDRVIRANIIKLGETLPSYIELPEKTQTSGF